MCDPANGNGRKQMPNRFRWTAWWYASISLAFFLLAANRVILRDRPWLIGVRVVIAAGFAVLSMLEFRGKNGGS
ncbi:MAG TPA: hypothetical protein VL285_06145 [Bryobacteraceae bacterium]|nr:hypothetical protein [Bryobacteraceae bacterium]